MSVTKKRKKSNGRKLMYQSEWDGFNKEWVITLKLFEGVELDKKNRPVAYEIRKGKLRKKK